MNKNTEIYEPIGIKLDYKYKQATLLITNKKINF
jgi:hypothetical protein